MSDLTPTLDRTTATTDEGDHDRMAHIVAPASAVTEAYITGATVTALCGKTWVPTRSPERFPLCQTCAEVLAEAKRRKAEGGS